MCWRDIKYNKSSLQQAMLGFINAAIFSITVAQSGEGAEEMVVNLPVVLESYIHVHEEFAEVTN